MASNVDVAALRGASARRRATGAPWLPLALGFERLEAGPGFFALGTPARVGVTELAVLADFALGAALRTRLGTGTVLATLSLTLQLESSDGGGDAVVRARAERVDGAAGGAWGDILVGGKPVGACVASFALPRADARRASPLPWEEPPGTAADRAKSPPFEALGPEDATALAAAEAAPGCSLADALVRPLIEERHDGRASGRLEAGALVLNRAGHVQGGALAGLAVAVARAAAGRPSAQVLSANVAFLSSASPGVVTARARVDRAGRRAAFVRGELVRGAAIVSTATVVLGAAS